MFDPVTWASGFILTKLSARLLKAFQSDELQDVLEPESSGPGLGVQGSAGLCEELLGAVIAEDLARIDRHLRGQCGGPLSGLRLHARLQDGRVPSEGGVGRCVH